MPNKNIKRIFAAFQAADPDPRTELAYKNEFTLLVAIVLSAQATDVSVNKATGPLFAKYDTPEAILELGEEGLKAFIKTIGLYNAKAKNVIALCRALIDAHGGEVPHGRAELEALAGVGKKTASVWLNCVLGIPTIAVDTHVFRVSHRLGIADGETPDKVQAQLEQRVPKQYLLHAHHWLILHGRYVCTARAPKCHQCRVEALCPRIGVVAVAPPGDRKPAFMTANAAQALRGVKKPNAKRTPRKSAEKKGGA